LTDATPIYRSVMLECERRRQQLGVSMDRFSEFAGLPDRAYAKMVWPDGVAGRQATWESVQRVIDALFPDGFDLMVKPRKGPELDKLSMKFKARFGQPFRAGKAIREHMSELSRRATPEARSRGRKQHIERARRREIARLAANARWKK
jgi:hypothetical protein